MHRISGLLLAALAIGAAGLAAADPVGRAATRGQEDYRFHCSVCHGPEGRGNGAFAVMLKAVPTDLTKLAAENGGSFPFERIYRVIDGRIDYPGHGGPEMPVWGNEFNDRAIEEERETARPVHRETYIAGRILGLTMYLLSIQE
ncbi:MAG: c-type cytochrome [Pseudomonadota bacterium]